MTPSNLGIVFGPNLVKKRAHGAAVDSYEPESQSRADLIAFLVEHYVPLFMVCNFVITPLLYFKESTDTSLLKSIQEEREQRAEAKKRMWSTPLNHRNREFTNTGMRRMKSEFLTRRGGSAIASMSEEMEQAISSSSTSSPVIPLQEKVFGYQLCLNNNNHTN